jgi:hypothetical protein
MEQVQLGAKGPTVSRLGLGCMGMSSVYGPADRGEALATLAMAAERGITLLDTGDFYGMGHNEMLIGEALKSLDRDKLTLSVKFGRTSRHVAVSLCITVYKLRRPAAARLSHLLAHDVCTSAPKRRAGRYRNYRLRGRIHLPECIWSCLQAHLRPSATPEWKLLSKATRSRRDA